MPEREGDLSDAIERIIASETDPKIQGLMRELVAETKLLGPIIDDQRKRTKVTDPNGFKEFVSNRTNYFRKLVSQIGKPKAEKIVIELSSQPQSYSLVELMKLVEVVQ